MSDGTFGTTAEQEPMPAELVEALELHRFDPLKSLAWRNSDLEFSSVDGLLASLDVPPPSRALSRAREGDDQRALAALAQDGAIRDRARHRDGIRLLWDVCQIPDFRKTLTDSHTRLLSDVFHYLVSSTGRLPTDWVARQVQQLDRVDGDIDALMARISGTRTWTYLSHRAGWLDDPVHWQDRTRAIEDKLSDALHARLTQRFVDRRTAVLVRRLREGDELLGAVTRSGEVMVEGEFVGDLAGFRFNPDKLARGDDTRPLMNAAQRVLRSEIGHRVSRLAAEPDEAFSLGEDGRILWEGSPVAHLTPGADVLSPRVEAITTDLLEREHRDRIRLRTGAWLKSQIECELSPLFRIGNGDEERFSGPARGLAYSLREWLGLVPRGEVETLIAKIGRAERRSLAAADVRIGSESVYLTSPTGPTALQLRRLLWAVYNGRPIGPALPRFGRKHRSHQARPELPESYYAAIGMRLIGGRAMPAERLERVAQALRKVSQGGAFALPPGLHALAGCSAEELVPVIEGLGYGRTGDPEEAFIWRGRRSAQKERRRSRRASVGGPASPFAKLRELDLGR